MVEIIKHEIDIDELKSFVDSNYVNSNDNINLRADKLYKEDSINDFSVKHYFDIKHFDYFNHLLKKVKDFNEIEVTNVWTVYGQKGMYHRLHNHKSHDNYHQADYTCLIYLNLPQDISENGLFFYINENQEEISIVPNTHEALIFPYHVYHGTYPQGEGLRQTLNIEFRVS